MIRLLVPVAILLTIGMSAVDVGTSFLIGAGLLLVAASALDFALKKALARIAELEKLLQDERQLARWRDRGKQSSEASTGFDAFLARLGQTPASERKPD